MADPWQLFCFLSGIAVGLSLMLYWLPILLLSFVYGPQDFRSKYGNWALVTGASSGIGLSVARKLAAQGVNVCVVALDDKLFAPAISGLRNGFPEVEIRQVPVDLSKDPDVYMSAICEATADIKVSIVVNNAGFLRMGYFDEQGISAVMGNIECNVLAAIRITHYFYEKMVEDKRKGLIAFTSSAAWFIPAPYATMYSATKAMMSNFANSLSIEAKNHGVDVTVVHPSYTHTGLYEGQPKLDVLKLLAKIGWTPDDVASVLFTSAGRVVVRDAGMYSMLTNLLGRLIDAGTLVKVIMPFRSGLGPPPKAR